MQTRGRIPRNFSSGITAVINIESTKRMHELVAQARIVTNAETRLDADAADPRINLKAIRSRESGSVPRRLVRERTRT